MSNRAITWAMDQETGSPIKKLILIRLADQANDEGYCWPGKTSIARDCEVHRKTVQRALQELQDQGLIRIEKRSRGQLNITNTYWLNIGVGAQDSQWVHSAPTVGAEDTQGGCTALPGVGAQRSPNPHIEPSVKPHRTNGGSQKGKKRATQVTDDFTPNEQHRKLGRELGVDVDFERGKFVDYCLATGKSYKNWDAAFRNWLRNSVKFGGGGKTQERTQSVGMFPDD